MLLFVVPVHLLLLTAAFFNPQAATATAVSPSTCPTISVPNPFPQIPLNTNSFILNGLVGQAPQTRVFDFTLTVGRGAPDGVEREILVVNGIYASLS